MVLTHINSITLNLSIYKFSLIKYIHTHTEHYTVSYNCPLYQLSFNLFRLVLFSVLSCIKEGHMLAFPWIIHTLSLDIVFDGKGKSEALGIIILPFCG